MQVRSADAFRRSSLIFLERNQHNGEIATKTQNQIQYFPVSQLSAGGVVETDYLNRILAIIPLSS